MENNVQNKILKESIFSMLHFIYFKISALVTFSVGLYFTIIMFVNFRKDTTILSNGAFIILALLASLCFSCARCFERDINIKDKFTSGGEKCFHGAIMLLLASVLKYALISINTSTTYLVIKHILDYIIGGLASLLFLWAMISAHTGVLSINNLLGRQFLTELQSDEPD